MMLHLIQSRFHNNQDGCQKGRVETFELQKENLGALQRTVFTSGPSLIFAVTSGITLQKGPAEGVLHLDPALAQHHHLSPVLKYNPANIE